MTKNFARQLKINALPTLLLVTASLGGAFNGPTAAQTTAPAAAQTSAPPPAAAPVAAPMDTAHFLQEYKRIVHLMDPKEVSREALAAYDQAVEAAVAGKFNEAFDKLEAAQTLDAKKEESRVLWAPYAQLINEQAQFPRGLAFLQTLAFAYPKLAHLHTNLASTYGMYAGWLKERDRNMMLQVSNQSRAEYEVALALNPNSFQALFGHATYLSYVPGQDEVWEAEFRKLIAMRPADLHGFPFSAVYQAFVSALVRNEQSDKARRVLQEGLQLYPKSAALQALATTLAAKPPESTQ